MAASRGAPSELGASGVGCGACVSGLPAGALADSAAEWSGGTLGSVNRRDRPAEVEPDTAVLVPTLRLGADDWSEGPDQR